eukprot:3943418-Pyramimonas_sp.AAC.1
MPGVPSIRDEDIVDGLSSMDVQARLKSLRAVKNQIIGALPIARVAHCILQQSSVVTVKHHHIPAMLCYYLCVRIDQFDILYPERFAPPVEVMQPPDRRARSVLRNKTKKISYLKLGAIPKVVEMLATETSSTLLVQSAAALGRYEIARIKCTSLAPYTDGYLGQGMLPSKKARNQYFN